MLLKTLTAHNLLYSYSTATLQLLYSYSAATLQLLYSYSTATLQLLCTAEPVIDLTILSFHTPTSQSHPLLYMPPACPPPQAERLSSSLRVGPPSSPSLLAGAAPLLSLKLGKPPLSESGTQPASPHSAQVGG